eukprot:6594295-Heterocapsa_arctica.AAC.1
MERLATAGLRLLAPRAHHSPNQQYILQITIRGVMTDLCNMDECSRDEAVPEAYTRYGIDVYVSGRQGHSAAN